MIQYEEFSKIDVRIGKIVKAERIENAKYTTHRIIIDFGEKIGQKQSCARLINYSTEELIGKNIIGILNFPPKQIGKNISEVLTLGVPDAENECVLLSPDKEIPLGGKVY
ncbi:MAG: tRNA-binding protein [Candidatus Moranbacteria bacterium]|nr:tRNA-binding protein [Candidatus Moranbacteria bacterium]